MTKFLTWLDIRRKIIKETRYGNQNPDGVSLIRYYPDLVEIFIDKEEKIPTIKETLKQWFDSWLDTDEDENLYIILEINNEDKIPIEFTLDRSLSDRHLKIRPLWHEAGYLLDNDPQSSSVPLTQFPDPVLEKPEIIAFYSFKGGVGRTLSLTAYLFALVEEAKKRDRELKILVIDADLEAPGLTYWYDDSEKSKPTISFIEFLEVHQNANENDQKEIDYVASELNDRPKRDGKQIIYFLPAFLHQEQLLDIQILPENITRNLNGDWEYSKLIHRLGRALEVDYIFIDLRAGLSEISSPILLDRRIQCFLVTTLNSQAIKGTELVLKIMKAMQPLPDNEENEKYDQPSIVINMIPRQIEKLPVFQASKDILLDAYSFASEENNLLDNVFQESYFAEELLYIKNWDDAKQKLTSTTINKNAQQWAKEQLDILENPQQNFKLEEVEKLQKICHQYIYAEEAEGEDFLITEALQNLADHFQNRLPNILSIGAKGSGKTFHYLQLARQGYWEEFLNKVNPNSAPSHQTYILPLLEATKLSNSAKEITKKARTRFSNDFKDKNIEIKPFDPSITYQDIINPNLTNNQNWSEKQWSDFWLNLIAETVGLIAENVTLDRINQFLLENTIRVVFMIDGLEDILDTLENNETQQTALKALIEYIPDRIARLRKPALGLIVFVRKDYIQHTIKQNIGQFESRYHAYDLTWDSKLFVELVYWLCSKANILDTKEENLMIINRNQIKEKLEKLWGKKLGSDKSNAASSISWIFTALADFNGNVQARDIVRFLYYAAQKTVENATRYNFDKWSKSRLLPPQAIRSAIELCSQDKVEEVQQEYSVFKKWSDNLDNNSDKSNRTIPFDIEQFDWDRDVVNVLKSIGVIYEDTKKNDPERFYIPEIFREGLNFSTSDNVDGRKVSALKRRILGSDII